MLQNNGPLCSLVSLFKSCNNICVVFQTVMYITALSDVSVTVIILSLNLGKKVPNEKCFLICTLHIIDKKCEK